MSSKGGTEIQLRGRAPVQKMMMMKRKKKMMIKRKKKMMMKRKKEGRRQGEKVEQLGYPVSPVQGKICVLLTLGTWENLKRMGEDGKVGAGHPAHHTSQGMPPWTPC